jgi:16S rRNA processing protein RimM
VDASDPPVSDAAAAWLSGGRVGRPHGLDGSFHVTRPRPQLLSLGVAVRVAGADTEIVRRAGTDDRPILRLRSFEGRDAADALRGEELLVARHEAPALEEGAFWAEDVAGLRVVDGAAEVGRVRQLVGLPSCEALEVERTGRPDLLVPLVRDAVRAVDLEGGCIDVDLAFLGEQHAPAEDAG